MTQAAKLVESGPRQPVICICGKSLYDGIVFKCRVIRHRPDGALEGKCRCKRWTVLPLTYTP